MMSNIRNHKSATLKSNGKGEEKATKTAKERSCRKGEDPGRGNRREEEVSREGEGEEEKS
jgi:hypothetical protein